MVRVEVNKTWRKEPAHDWSSHGADAARYLAQCYENEYIDRTVETISTGMEEPIFGSNDDDYEPVRNRAGGFVSQDCNYSLERVTQRNPVTGKKIRSIDRL
jgi:hypothetical protein